MEVAVLTIGDELLAGDVENTNATWLARTLTARGVAVTRILVVPDDEALIAEYVREWADAFDAVVTTGGLGGTHDDLTMAAVARAVDRPLEPHPDARTDVAATVRRFREANPDLDERFPELTIDLDAQASMPAGARYLSNEEGLSPGCVVGTDGGARVYVFPGIPEEMHAMFEAVADDFGGDVVAERVYTPVPEGGLTEALAAVRERFDVAVGSYPSREGPNRVKLVGTDAEAVADAAAWLRERIETAPAPEGGGGPSEP